MATQRNFQHPENVHELPPMDAGQNADERSRDEVNGFRRNIAYCKEMDDKTYRAEGNKFEKRSGFIVREGKEAFV
jgi:hypothetical protein